MSSITKQRNQFHQAVASAVTLTLTTPQLEQGESEMMWHDRIAAAMADRISATLRRRAVVWATFPANDDEGWGYTVTMGRHCASVKCENQ